LAISEPCIAARRRPGRRAPAAAASPHPARATSARPHQRPKKDAKTRVLVVRVSWLVATGRARPEEVCAAMFMNDAARQIRARLATALGEQVARQVWVGTSHRLAVRLLRGQAPTSSASTTSTLTSRPAGRLPTPPWCRGRRTARLAGTARPATTSPAATSPTRRPRRLQGGDRQPREAAEAALRIHGRRPGGGVRVRGSREDISPAPQTTALVLFTGAVQRLRVGIHTGERERMEPDLADIVVARWGSHRLSDPRIRHGQGPVARIAASVARGATDLAAARIAGEGRTATQSERRRHASTGDPGRSTTHCSIRS
jgi:superfamily I DNA/RNA helicase